MKKSTFLLFFLSLTVLYMACFSSLLFERKSLVLSRVEVKTIKEKEQKQVKEEKEKEKEEKDTDDESEKEERSFEKETDWNHYQGEEISLMLVGIDIASFSPYKVLQNQNFTSKIYTPPKC